MNTSTTTNTSATQTQITMSKLPSSTHSTNNSTTNNNRRRFQITINPTYQIRDSITTPSSRRMRSRARDVRNQMGSSERLCASDRLRLRGEEYDFLLGGTNGEGKKLDVDCGGEMKGRGDESDATDDEWRVTNMEEYIDENNSDHDRHATPTTRRRKRGMSTRRSLSMNDAHCYGIDELLMECSSEEEEEEEITLVKGGGDYHNVEKSQLQQRRMIAQQSNKQKSNNNDGSELLVMSSGLDKSIDDDDSTCRDGVDSIIGATTTDDGRTTNKRDVASTTACRDLLTTTSSTTTVERDTTCRKSSTQSKQVTAKEAVEKRQVKSNSSSNSMGRSRSFTNDAREYNNNTSNKNWSSNDDWRSNHNGNSWGSSSIRNRGTNNNNNNSRGTNNNNTTNKRRSNNNKVNNDNINDGNELLAMASSGPLDKSDLSSDFTLKRPNSQSRRQQHKPTNKSSSSIKEQKSPTIQRRRSKSSNVRRSLSMNDAERYCSLEELRCYDGDENEDVGVEELWDGGGEEKGSSRGVGEARGVDGRNGKELKGFASFVEGRKEVFDGGADDAAGGTTSHLDRGDRRVGRGHQSLSLLQQQQQQQVALAEGADRFNDLIQEREREGNSRENEDGDERRRRRRQQKKQQRQLLQQRQQQRLDERNVDSIASLQQNKQRRRRQSTSSESDDSCPEMNRIYNTPPRNDDVRKRRELKQPPPQQQNQQLPRPQERLQLPPQPPPPPAQTSTSSTMSNNSIMDDYIQLKLKVAELQSELQLFQSESSKYRLKLLDYQQENEELRHENTSLRRERVVGGACELKEENEFMKRVLYNLERLGKIDKVDELLKSRLDDSVEERRSGYNINNSQQEGRTVSASMNGGGSNRRPVLRKAHSSNSSRPKWGEDFVDWGSSSDSSKPAQPPPRRATTNNTNGPPRRGSILFRRLSVPFAPPAPFRNNNNNDDDDVVEVEEQPMTDAAAVNNNSRISRRSFSHGSLSNLFRWPSEDAQDDTSTNVATIRLDQSDSRVQLQSRPNAIGEAIKNIQRSFSNKDVRDNVAASTAVKASAHNNNNDGDKKDVPEYVHTDPEANLLQVSEISSDVVPSSRIPTMGGGTSSNSNVDIRQTAKQASTRPNNRGRGDRGLFGSFIREIIREENG